MSIPFEVLTYPNPILFDIAKPVIDWDGIPEIIQRMKTTLSRYNGVGLAAPQVGISLRIILVCFEKNNNNYTSPIVMINPTILSKSAEEIWGEEGCLSLPNIFDSVKRPKHIKVEYQNITGQLLQIHVEDFNARVIQHEIDHLDGIMFFERPHKKESLKKDIDQIFSAHL